MDRRLQQFLAVAETGNVTLAAKRLNISQPTLSVSIRRLEEHHRVALFERSSRGVVLTEFGTILYEHARVMARLEDHATAEIRNLRTSARKALKIGVGYAWWSVLMREVVSDFRAEQPDVSVRVDVASSLDGLRNLVSGDISLFLGTEVAHVDAGLGLQFEPLFGMEDGHFARRGHPLDDGAVSASHLDRFERLDVVPIVDSHLGIVGRGTSVGRDPAAAAPERAVLSSNSMNVCLDLMRGGDAVLTYPVVAKPFFDANGACMLDIEGPRAVSSIGLYSLGEQSRNASLHDVKARIRAAVASVLTAGQAGVAWMASGG